jgi:uncharacterized protein
MELQPASTFIFKLADRCNLACRYCYVFEFDRNVSRTKPATLSHDTLISALRRVAEHVRENQLPDVVIALHGGEPLLIGKRRFEQYVRSIREELTGIDHAITLQTNGLLLDALWLDLFAAHKIQFCISLDGAPEANDRYRVTRKGEGTGVRVLDTIRAVIAHPASPLFNGVLCVANPHASGRGVYEFFVNSGIRKLDFLMPDGNYHAPPVQLKDRPRHAVGDFLVEAFDAWFEQDDPLIEVRLYSQIITGLLGGATSLENFGGIDGSIAIIETDGGVLPHDVLRICGPPFDRSTLHVARNKMIELRDERFFPWRELATQCQECEILSVCRGGYPPHRFDGRSFLNPSFYCEELQQVIKHIAGVVLRALPPERRAAYPLLISAQPDGAGGTSRDTGI